MKRIPVFAFTILAALNLASALHAADKPASPEAEVYLLSGQSNMLGHGPLDGLPANVKKPCPNVFFWTGKAFEPLVIGKTKTSPKADCCGPELGFAATLSAKRPGTPVYLIKLAMNGQPLNGGFDSIKWVGPGPGPKRKTFYPGTSGKDPNVGLHYRKLNQCITQALAGLEKKNIRYKIKGILWMQGETDAKALEAAKEYPAMLRLLKERLGQDFQCPDVPLIYGQVLPYASPATKFPGRAEIRKLMAAADAKSGSKVSIPNAWMVSTDAVPLNSDHIHYSGSGQWQLGTAFAEKLLKVTGTK